MKANEIRQSFLEFFAARGHRVVRSSSLVPAADPTLLFTNAGMNQFKDVFLGLERREYARAASSQKCLRVSGKHNDLENVGRTRRHHTFFEMLGNFSFGDYFKQDAIRFAWELVTGVWKLPKDKLYATVFLEDDEAYGVWEKEIGLPAARLHRLGEEENFWAMGDTGPCGPCSEIHYDFGPAASDSGHKDCAFPCECGRYVELWNLVFMQFNRDAKGNLTPLPKPSVDTGAGLERLAAALQGKVSNYDTDLFRPLIEEASELAGKSYGDDPRTDVALRVIADHSRAAAFVVGDGVLPSNEGRGYVLRKIIRRAIQHGAALGLNDPFLYKVAGRVAELMRAPYPELLENINRITTVIKQEEIRFKRTISIAIEEFGKTPVAIFEKAMVILPHSGGTGLRDVAVPVRGLDQKDYRVADHDGQFILNVTGESSRTIKYRSGYVGTLLPDATFKLYDTYGLPLDFIRELAEERKVWVDEEAFLEAINKQRERAKASWKGEAKQVIPPALKNLLEFGKATDFSGYEDTTVHQCQILMILVGDVAVPPTKLRPGQVGNIILDRTPFYAEAGGQVGDTGWFKQGDELLADVLNTYSPVQGVIAQHVRARTELGVGDYVTTEVDKVRRAATMRNHTGTHLLHAALRKVLGPHVKQSGSLVAPDRLRFDFSHYAALDPEELKEIERLANDQILRDVEVKPELMDLDAALKSGALAFFGDKYPAKNVRVITVPDPAEETGFYSKELCGGTHVAHTGQIGVLKIVSESSIAAGVRRVEALTGDAVLQYCQALEDFADTAKLMLEGGKTLTDLQRQYFKGRGLEPLVWLQPLRRSIETIEQLMQRAKQLEKQLQATKRRSAHQQVGELAGRARRVKDVGVLAVLVEDADRETMRALADALRQKLGSGVIVLGAAEDGKVALLAAVTKDLTKKLHAGKIVKEVAERVGGTGGGRPDLAEAGGKDPARLPQALEDVYAIIERML